MLPSHCFGEQCEGSMAYLGKGLDFRPRVFSYGSDVAHARSCTGRPGSVFLRAPAARVLARRLKRRLSQVAPIVYPLSCIRPSLQTLGTSRLHAVAIATDALGVGV